MYAISWWPQIRQGKKLTAKIEFPSPRRRASSTRANLSDLISILNTTNYYDNCSIKLGSFTISLFVKQSSLKVWRHTWWNLIPGFVELERKRFPQENVPNGFFRMKRSESGRTVKMKTKQNTLLKFWTGFMTRFEIVIRCKQKDCKNIEWSKTQATICEQAGSIKKLTMSRICYMGRSLTAKGLTKTTFMGWF